MGYKQDLKLRRLWDEKKNGKIPPQLLDFMRTMDNSMLKAVRVLKKSPPRYMDAENAQKLMDILARLKRIVDQS